MLVFCCLATKVFRIVSMGSFQAINKCNNLQTKQLYLWTICFVFISDMTCKRCPSPLKFCAFFSQNKFDLTQHFRRKREDLLCVRGTS